MSRLSRLRAASATDVPDVLDAPLRPVLTLTLAEFLRRSFGIRTAAMSRPLRKSSASRDRRRLRTNADAGRG